VDLAPVDDSDAALLPLRAQCHGTLGYLLTAVSHAHTSTSVLMTARTKPAYTRLYCLRLQLYAACVESLVYI
jgi:hypothetical protein